MASNLLMVSLFFLLCTATASEKFDLTTKASWVLEKYCYDCHDEDTQKGKIRLDNLSNLSQSARLDLLNKVQEQIYIKEMPPRKKKKQLREVERQYMVGWVAQELKKYNASKLEDKMRYPNYGNYIDHEKLFSGKIKAKAYTPARRWLVSPHIFNDRINSIFQGQGTSSFYGVTNPIILPDKSGVRYYDNMLLDGGHLLVMLTNAEWLASKQIRAARVKNGELKANAFVNNKDRWYPKLTPAAFEKIILKKSKPTNQEMEDAVHAQFNCVMQRQASVKEVQKYVPLLQSTIQLGGNTEGLRQMLISVLLESEFLYRLEFGAGPKDRSGRKKLSSREASYAIAYALSDRIPDATLVKAVKDGKLTSKEDYKREVLRLLNDKKSFFGQCDSNITGRNLKSHKVSHPKIIRFFREFFGYSNMGKVFKDTKRSGGFYGNAGRGTAGTAGNVINEADRVVDLILKEDKDVFAQLLTTDKYFVYHHYDNVAGAKIVKNWIDFYNKYKDTDWKKNEPEIARQNPKLVSPSSKKGRHNTTVARLMKHMAETYAKGKTPFPTLPWVHGYSFNHSEIYSFPKLAKPPYTNKESWSYPLKQPFKVPNRMGILTHPSWLVAHSQNAHTDPILRGRWIREKLLAGRVPDVPITVDAQVPEDHHKTLRQRFDMVTKKSECWKCHVYMNPLGFPFEMYDDFGRYRKNESLEHEANVIGKEAGKYGTEIYKTLPVDPSGYLSGTGNPKLDGKVNNAIDMISRLAKSKRVRQSIIRYAFRYFMGRNEMLSDSRTLIDADQAYVKSGGSFKAVVVSLLTSDSFMYRK
jgi:hypothetical protein